MFAPHEYGCYFRAHPVCGESHIQRNANGEVATAQYDHELVEPDTSIGEYANQAYSSRNIGPYGGWHNQKS